MKTKVLIIESERGWGQRIDEELKFDSRAEAEEFVKKFNKFNDLDDVPDLYMYAEIVERKNV